MYIFRRFLTSWDFHLGQLRHPNIDMNKFFHLRYAESFAACPNRVLQDEKPSSCLDMFQQRNCRLGY